VVSRHIAPSSAPKHTTPIGVVAPVTKWQGSGHFGLCVVFWAIVKRKLSIVTGIVCIALIATTKTTQAQTDFFATGGVINDATNNAFSFTVAGLAPSTTNASLTLNLTHSFDSDISIYLFSPTGQKLMLSFFNGGSGQDYTNTVFSDAGGDFLSAGSAPFTGSFLPDGLVGTFNDNGTNFTTNISTFSGFFGNNPNGLWTLQINDTSAGDSGSLLATTKLTLTAAIPEPSTLALFMVGSGGVWVKRRRKIALA
jgi:subtilisin-like proprotein convertase family protein